MSNNIERAIHFHLHLLNIQPAGKDGEKLDKIEKEDRSRRFLHEVVDEHLPENAQGKIIDKEEWN